MDHAGESPIPDARSCVGTAGSTLREVKACSEIVPQTAQEQQGEGKEQLLADGNAPNSSPSPGRDDLQPQFLSILQVLSASWRENIV